MTEEGGRALPVSWLVALIATVGMLATVLVFTQDLAVTNTKLAVGVTGVEQASAFTARASTAAGALSPAPVVVGVGEIEAVGGLLEQSVAALVGMQADLHRLGRVFGLVGAPATASIQAVGGAERSAADAAKAVARTATALDQVRAQLRALTPLFDETAARAARIEAKLRPLRLGS